MRSKFCTTLALTVAFFSPPAAAQGTGDIQFAGTVTEICALTLSTAGVLVQESNNTVFSSENGLAGQASLLTTGTGFNVEVDAPTNFTLAPLNGGANVTFAAGYTTTGATTVTDILAGTVTPLLVGLTNLFVDVTAIKSTGTFPAGLYETAATVRCVAN